MTQFWHGGQMISSTLWCTSPSPFKLMLGEYWFLSQNKHENLFISYWNSQWNFLLFFELQSKNKDPSNTSSCEEKPESKLEAMRQLWSFPEPFMLLSIMMLCDCLEFLIQNHDILTFIPPEATFLECVILMNKFFWNVWSCQQWKLCLVLDRVLRHFLHSVIC